jgi:hypothetical protein
VDANYRCLDHYYGGSGSTCGEAVERHGP